MVGNPISVWPLTISYLQANQVFVFTWWNVILIDRTVLKCIQMTFYWWLNFCYILHIVISRKWLKIWNKKVSLNCYIWKFGLIFYHWNKYEGYKMFKYFSNWLWIARWSYCCHHKSLIVNLIFTEWPTLVFLNLFSFRAHL